MPTFDSLAALLYEHRLTGVVEQPFEHSGFSGAALTRLVRGDGCDFILKRMSMEHDWIMRATDDVSCREAAFAAAAPDLGERLQTPAVGVARDGDTHALLMRDISAQLLPPGAITSDQLDLIIGGMMELHARGAPPGLPSCDLTRRLTLLTPSTAGVAQAYGAPVAGDVIEGWRVFDQLVTPQARKIVFGLLDDAAPLVTALRRMPSAFLHGDLKLDNIGLDAAGRMWLIDWSMTLVAPPAVELGWFLAINSRRLPVSLDDVTARYAAAAHLSPELRVRHDALTVLCGLLLRGWRKALDASAGDAGELLWWCERVEAGAAFL